MVLEAHVVLRHPGCYTEVVRDGARVVHLTTGPDRAMLVISAPTPDELERIVSTFARVNGKPFEVVERTPTTTVLRFTSCEGSIVRVIFGAGASVVWPAIFRDGLEHYTILANSREHLLDVVRRLSTKGEVRVTSVTQIETEAISASVPSADLLADLTQKQLEVLMLAVGRGYYRSPRWVNADELAHEMGVTRSTFAEHLRKAEERILARVAGAIEDQPAMRKAATRKTGRPPKAALRPRAPDGRGTRARAL